MSFDPSGGIPAIAAALSSTLIAITAVRRRKRPKPQPDPTLSDDAARYLFGPLYDAIIKSANDAVAVAMKVHAKPDLRSGHCEGAIIVKLIPTELNQRLASAVQYSVSADRFYIAGKAGFWRLVGLGLMLFGVGSAIGIGFYGYSHITRNSENLSTLSTTFSKALAEARLRATAEGTVEVEPREISLAKD